jgi:hypothetical protein
MQYEGCANTADIHSDHNLLVAKCNGTISRNVLHTMSDLVGKAKRTARKPQITQERISKRDEQRK